MDPFRYMQCCCSTMAELWLGAAGAVMYNPMSLVGCLGVFRQILNHVTVTVTVLALYRSAPPPNPSVSFGGGTCGKVPRTDLTFTMMSAACHTVRQGFLEVGSVLRSGDVTPYCRG